MRKKFNIILMALAAALLLAACAEKAEPAAADTPGVTEEASAKPTDEPAAGPEETENVKEEPAEMAITDMAGREVNIPVDINTVFGVNNTASILLYTIVPTKMIGWNISFSDEAKAFMMPECAGLPVLGNLYGSGKKAEIEEIASRAPDVIVLAGTKANDSMISAADDLQAQLGIPVVVVLGKMESYDKTYGFLGEIFGEKQRAAELGAYAKSLVESIAETSAKIAPEDMIGVYYARGDEGLETEFEGSPNAEVLKMVGGKNVIAVAGEAKSGTVSIEEVIARDPEVILIGNQGASKNLAYQAIMESGLWDGISAVEKERVKATPQYPFNWFDRPPTVNRLIGLVWLAEELYPDVYGYDAAQEAMEFFKLFYGVDATYEQIESLMD